MKRLALLLPLLLAVPQGLPKGQDDLLAARSKGSVSAPVTVYEMSDFQCPWCRKQVTEVFPDLERDYVETGKVRWVFINFPLTELHPNSAAAAEFAMCAAKAGKFWPVHDALFKYQDKWAPLKDPGPFLITLADTVGLARSALLPCLQSGDTRSLVQADADGAAKSGASSTPSFYIEGGMLSGAKPYALWKQILDSVLVVKKAGKS